MKAGGYLKGLVALVGGSTSGFSAVIGAYVTTITTTIIVVAICAALAVCMYCARMDQRLRMDARYGGEPSDLPCHLRWTNACARARMTGVGKP